MMTLTSIVFSREKILWFFDFSLSSFKIWDDMKLTTIQISSSEGNDQQELLYLALSASPSSFVPPRRSSFALSLDHGEVDIVTRLEWQTNDAANISSVPVFSHFDGHMSISESSCRFSSSFRSSDLLSAWLKSNFMPKPIDFFDRVRSSKTQ